MTNIQFADSWGKIPSGILSGNSFEPGNFDQCLDIKHWRSSTDTISTQYCLAQVSFEFASDMARHRTLYDFMWRLGTNLKGMDLRMLLPNSQNAIAINLGICAPDTCSPETIKSFIDALFSQLNVTGNSAVTQESCQRQEIQTYRAVDIFTISLFGIIIVLMITSTIYDVWMTRQKKQKHLSLIAFSMYTNGQKIFQCKNSKSPDVINCLNGIRVLSIVWVVFGHSHMLLAIGPLINSAYLIKWISNVYSMLLLAAPVSVDSFFLLSGLLVTWSILKHLDSSNGKLPILWIYFHRYLRLTPSLAAAILLCSTVLRHLGSGPLWNVYLDTADKPCQEYWWSALLYIQNYVNPSKICLGHSWYLSVDMQLFILSPLILYPLWRWKHKFVWTVPFLIILSMACTFSIFMVNQFTSQFVKKMMGGNEMEKTYYPTHTRMGAWLVGVLLGYILHNLKGTMVVIPKLWIAVGWTISLGSILTIIFGIYNMQQPSYPISVLESAFYEAFSRVSWAISLSWIVFACVHGYGGPVNWFLSLPEWQPIARLSYAIYIVHLPLQLVLTASTRVPSNFSDITAIHKFWGDFGLSLTVAIFWTMAFESPILVFEKIIQNLQRGSKKTTTSQEDLLKEVEISNNPVPLEKHENENNSARDNY